ncbi:hypothetical protein [Microbacterium sp. SORGH_AS_0862]|uniref:hypothetical protein n=1 Tax=Microbacterium sp. SORGH_AS_0862 TaxID=3041789 RepID=UPI002793F2EE|nr:hypothetical protein [Microbacterium sp. SORGH_AS_0862]MDQ1206353.1 hypothetical protein [Microbacterium sp. SORGH_AS_0862]
MAERTWFEGPLPAIATDTLAVIVGGDAAVAAARRVLSTGTMPGTPEILDALLTDGIAAVPAFAVVALDDDRLTAFVRGEFVLRFEDRSRRVWRVDGVGAHTWREVEAASVVRAWAGAPDAEPKLFDLGPTPERPVRVGPTTAAGIMLRGRPAVVRPPIPSAAPPAAAAPRPRPAAAEPADDETVVTSSSALAPKPAPRTPRAPRAIELPGGDIVPIHGTLLVGRGPRSSRVEGDDLPTLVALGDVSRDVSRAHVKIWTDGTRVQIEDLATPGGTAVIDADGVARLLVPDRAVEVREGASAELAGGARIRFVGDA